MFTSRRDFLKASVAGSSMIALGSSVPAFLTRTAAAAQTANQPGSRDTILVVIQLTGGNDGLNTVIPYANEEYTRLRPTLRQPREQVQRINDEVGLHASLFQLSELLQDGKLCVVQGVGYPNPSQSHFRSMDIWQAARTTGELNEGWIGRALRAIPGAASFHLADQNEAAPLALNGAPIRVPSITSLSDFQLRVNGSGPSDINQQRSVIQASANPSGQPGLLDFVQRTSVNTYASSQRLQEISRNYTPATPYPATGLGNHLQLAAQLIDAGLGARLFYVSLGGFDTHSSQGGTHSGLLGQLGGAMNAFYRDMAQKGHGDRVLMMTFSEFGRRARENGSQGTDHGEAAPMFLVGGRVRSGVVGAHPSLTNLSAGNLRHHTDFRQVYAAILDNWLGVNSRQVLGERFEPVNVLQG
jgi:uncharacterized protein (DUF1501 family)